jgi:hypothetical protein
MLAQERVVRAIFEGLLSQFLISEEKHLHCDVCFSLREVEPGRDSRLVVFVSEMVSPNDESALLIGQCANSAFQCEHCSPVATETITISRPYHPEHIFTSTTKSLPKSTVMPPISFIPS